MHCTQAIPIKELKKWTKIIVKKQYTHKRLSKEQDKWVDISENSLKIKKDEAEKTPKLPE